MVGRCARAVALSLLAAAGCGKVHGRQLDAATPPDGGTGADAAAGATDAAPPDPPDAAPVPDATPVDCDGPEDCTDFADECNVGACDPERQVCVKEPANEADSCGADFTCGDYGDCGGFASTCAESGTQARTCMTFTCQAGDCTGDASTESRACTRDTDGDDCGDPICGDFDDCIYAGDTDCGESGFQTRRCRPQICGGGSCGTGAEVDDTQACSRDTDGLSCGDPTCGPFGPCSWEGDPECDSTGSRDRTCVPHSCAAGECSEDGLPYTDSTGIGCERLTEGIACGGGPFCGGFGSCYFAGDPTCDEIAIRSRTCTQPLCTGDTCTGSQSTQEDEICDFRTTDDAFCSISGGICCYCSSSPGFPANNTCTSCFPCIG